jgi:valyl-tRNA synthetase
MLDKRYDPKTSEPRWQEYWETEGTFRWDPEDRERPVYSVDTPPPTVSGAMHVGHVFSYTQAEAMTRFWRQRGFNVFYPFGFDDNGLASERFVEKRKKVRAHQLPRAEFVKLCLEVTSEIEKKFRDLWKSLGFSADWSLEYSTIDERSQRISQRSFLDLLKKDAVYRRETPALWCTECRTAVAQAEEDDVEGETLFTDIAFALPDGGELVVATTRPELLPSCVCIFVHPEDDRHRHLVGKTARTPIFDLDVPIMTNEDVDREKGTGVVMCCTFGDTKDIEWWETFELPLNISIGRDGKMTGNAGDYAGLKIRDARRKVLEDLESAGCIRGQKTVEHVVNSHERCGTAIEFLPAKQWFIKVLEHQDALLDAGAEIEWYPASMQTRYRHWVENLKWDWCISRQRFMGVPIPVWICRDCEGILAPRDEDLPIDPHVTAAPGPCPACGGTDLFPEPDILDTWATSSVTPQINAHWGEKQGDLSDRILPMSLRPQSHDIIRTWAFYTIVKSFHHHGTIPWKQVMISGHVVDAEKKKISKSKLEHAPKTSLSKVFSNPEGLIKQFGADPVRYWACRGNLGVDTAYDEQTIKQGKRLMTKLWNAARFALGHLEGASDDEKVSEAIDRGLIAKLETMEDRVTGLLERYEIGTALRELESFFWADFCDNYLEMVKARLYEPERYGEAAHRSARATLRRTLRDLLVLLSPFTPHVTEELYQQGFRSPEDPDSVHRLAWPAGADSVDRNAVAAFDAAVDVIAGGRKFKSERSLSMGAPLERLTISAPGDSERLLRMAEAELVSTLRTTVIEFGTGEGEPQLQTEAGVRLWIEQPVEEESKT